MGRAYSGYAAWILFSLKVFINLLGNYLPNQWNARDGCVACKEDTVELNKSKVWGWFFIMPLCARTGFYFNLFHLQCLKSNWKPKGSFRKTTFPPSQNHWNLSEFTGKITRLHDPSWMPPWSFVWKPLDCVYSQVSIDYRTNICEKHQNCLGFGCFIFAGTSSCKHKKTQYDVSSAPSWISAWPQATETLTRICHTLHWVLQLLGLYTESYSFWNFTLSLTASRALHWVLQLLVLYTESYSF